MTKLGVSTFLFIIIAANACNSRVPTYKPIVKNDSFVSVDNFVNVDDFKSKITETNVFWHSKRGNFASEFLFRKDGTVTVLNYV